MTKRKQKEIKEISLLISLMEIQELTEGYRRRLLIMDSHLQALKAEREALRNETAALRTEIDRLASLYRINMQVLNIVNSPAKAGDGKWQKRGSPQSRMLKRFAQNTR